MSAIESVIAIVLGMAMLGAAAYENSMFLGVLGAAILLSGLYHLCFRPNSASHQGQSDAGDWDLDGGDCLGGLFQFLTGLCGGGDDHHHH